MSDNINAVDVMNYPFTPEGQKKFWASPEMQQLVQRMKGRTPNDVCSTQEFVTLMDETGYEKVLISAVKMGSYRERWLSEDFSNEEVYEQAKQFPNRIIGLASYDPFKIEESIKSIEKAVKEFNFKGVYLHTMSWGLPLNDKKFYPCYMKCLELGIPVQMQVGHAAEAMLSDLGRPVYLDDIALDFPNLNIIGSHTGWPWCEELISMCMKHDNVYLDISAWMPGRLWKPIVDFMDGLGRDKCLFGTNGFGLKRCKEQFMDMNIKEETKRKVLHDNAIKVYKL